MIKSKSKFPNIVCILQVIKIFKDLKSKSKYPNTTKWKFHSQHL